MGDRFKFASQLTREVGTAAFVPYTSLLTPNVVKLASGAYMQTMRLQGAAHESADIEDLNAWHDQLNGWMRNIASPNVALWSHIVRREFGEYPAGEYEPGFAHDFNEKYKARMASTRMLVNELYVSIVYQPQANKGVKMLESVFGAFGSMDPKQRADEQHDDLEACRELASTALAALDRYEPELLGTYEHRGALFSETLEFLSFLVDGEWRRFAVPKAEIRDVLCTTRPMFGKGGLMSFKGPARTQYGSIVTIQEWPAVTCPGLLNDLLSMPFEFVLSQSFTFLSKAIAIGRMKRQQSRMKNAGDVAQSQVEDIDDAMDDLQSNRFVMGAHNLALVIRGEDQKALNEFVADAGAALSDCGMKWAREEVGIAGAFWSQLPGNFEYRVRIGDITSRNYAGFSSLHNYPIGRLRHNQWGDAVTMFETTSGAPYYFNFHKGEEGSDAKRAAKMDPNHKDLANTIVIGKTGTGKTVLEMHMLAQVQKFAKFPTNHFGVKKLSCVMFDKDLGGAVAVRAMGGRYYPIKNGVPSGWNPFQLPVTPGTLTFLETLIKQLVKHVNYPFTPRQDKEIAEAVAGVMAAPQHLRRISAVLEFLDPTDANGVHARLTKWCGKGALAWLFDNPTDTLDVDNCNIVGFDVTEFLENEETRTPTMMYLMHRIEALFDGRRVPIFMDEFSRLLADEAFADFGKNKLVTIRKQDGFLVMFLQDPQQALDSPIAFAIINQTANKIFLPNPTADRKAYIEGFKLTEREFEIVRSLGEKSRMFLIKTGQNSVVAQLNLRGFDDELAVLSGNTATSLLAEKLVAELGADPAVWLPEFHKIRKGETA
jgi:type IV secretion system protein VirB4